MLNGLPVLDDHPAPEDRLVRMTGHHHLEARPPSHETFALYTPIYLRHDHVGVPQMNGARPPVGPEPRLPPRGRLPAP